TNGKSYTYVAYGFYNGYWVRLKPNNTYTATAGLDFDYYTNTGSRQTYVRWYGLDSEIVEKYAVYTYKDGKYYLVDANVPGTASGYLITGLTNGTKYGVLVRAYINGQWTSFTTDDIVYATPSLEKPYFSVTSTSNGVRIYISNSYYYGYKKAYIYKYDSATDKYTLIHTQDVGESSIYYTVTDADASDYGYLVRMSDGYEMTPFTSYDIEYVY
ncbi:MAG: hypothetical protein ACI4WS_10535, partial [Oscillospiraceae bacterium]